MAAMTSKFYYVCVIQYYTDQWLDSVRLLLTLYGGLRLLRTWRKSLVSSRKHVKNLNRYLAKIDIWYIVICVCIVCRGLTSGVGRE